ncbi:MAG: NfeD family protein [Polaromonas sp.]|nr:NfeD family protein [Polaromonas sp.]
MAESTLWWISAGVMVAIELATGTFYLLMLSIGMAAAALAAHLGMGLTGQLMTAAVVGGGAVAVWHWFKSKAPQAEPANANRDVHIDIGESIEVGHWNSDGTATVKYRGANWTALPADTTGGYQPTGAYRIKQMMGNRLILEKL